MDEPVDNNSEQVKKLMSIALDTLQKIEITKASCKDCEKCVDYKKLSDKCAVLLAKIITLQAKDIKQFETILEDMLKIIEKYYNNETKPETLH